jgi:hypothetical protein
MNEAIQAKLRKLTMYYNSLDFLAEKPGGEESEHSKIVTELERLFFDKDDPLLLSDDNNVTGIHQRLVAACESLGPTLIKIQDRIAANRALAFLDSAPGSSTTYGQDAARDQAILDNFNNRNPDQKIFTMYMHISDEGRDYDHPLFGKCFAEAPILDMIIDTPATGSLEYEMITDGGLAFVEMHSDVTSPIKRNANVLESYMNYIPNIERSKCVPDLQVKFSTKRDVAAESNTEQLAVFNFLNGENIPSPGEDIFKTGSADLLFTKASKININSGLVANRSQTTHGMEMFTMPQTLRSHISDSSPLGDPFRPLMSLDGASINIYAAGEGFISYKRATLNFTLFDRTRLKDISFLLDPSRYGNTIIEIDAGWNHPDESSPYGAILNEMRIKDTYQITKANFSMKGSSTFNITVDVAMLGGSDIFNKNIFSYGSNSNVITLRALAVERRKILSAYRTLSSALARSGADNGRLLPSSIITRSGDDDSMIALTDTAVTSLAAGKVALSALLASQPDDAEITQAQLTELTRIHEALSNANNPITSLSANTAESVSAFKTKIEDNDSKADYFLDTVNYDPAKFISFGKLFLNLVALPIITSELADSVHVIMYNFNKYAAKMGYIGSQSVQADEKHNLSTFALEQEAVVKSLKKHLEKKYFIAPADVMTYARGALSSRMNTQYGIVLPASNLLTQRQNRTDTQNAMSTNRQSLSDLTSIVPAAGASTADYRPLAATLDEGDETESFEARHASLTSLITDQNVAIEQLEEAIAEGLADATDTLMEQMGTSKIKMPDLKLFVETVKTKEGGKTIIRLHVYDANESPYELHEIAANMGIITDGTRLDDSTQTESLFNELSRNGHIINVPGNDRVAAHKALNIRNLKLKTAIKNNMPSITYGTEATAINSISLSTVSDSNVNTYFLLETRQKEEDTENPGDAPEPTETIQSAKDAQKIFPITMTIDMLGCPVIDFAQQMFIDLGTGTDLDNVYAAIDVLHNLKPGSFKTTVKMSPTFSGETVTFSDMISDIITAQARLEAGQDTPPGE